MDELVVHAAGHVGQGEAPVLVRQAGVEDDLEEQVAQLLLQMQARRRPVSAPPVRRCRGAAGSAGPQRVEHLVALLEQVRHQRRVRLHRSQGHCCAQRVHQGARRATSALPHGVGRGDGGM